MKPRWVCGNCGSFLPKWLKPDDERTENYRCRCGPDWVITERVDKPGRRRQQRFPGFPKRKRRVDG